MSTLVCQVRLFVLSRLLSSLWVSRTGSASDWCALQEALYKFIDTIQYNTLTAHCQLEDETVMEKTGHPSSYAEAKKIKLLTLHTHGSPRASLPALLLLWPT